MMQRRRIAVAAVIAGTLAVTGCSTNYGAGGPNPPQPAETVEEAPPSPAEYLLGSWECQFNPTGSNRLKNTFVISEDVIEWTQLDEDLDHYNEDSVMYAIVDNVLTITPRSGQGVSIRLPESIDFGATNKATVLQSTGDLAVDADLTPDSASLQIEGFDEPMTCDRTSRR